MGEQDQGAAGDRVGLAAICAVAVGVLVVRALIGPGEIEAGDLDRDAGRWQGLDPWQRLELIGICKREEIESGISPEFVFGDGEAYNRRVAGSDGALLRSLIDGYFASEPDGSEGTIGDVCELAILEASADARPANERELTAARWPAVANDPNVAVGASASVVALVREVSDNHAELDVVLPGDSLECPGCQSDPSSLGVVGAGTEDLHEGDLVQLEGDVVATAGCLSSDPLPPCRPVISLERARTLSASEAREIADAPLRRYELRGSPARESGWEVTPRELLVYDGAVTVTAELRNLHEAAYYGSASLRLRSGERRIGRVASTVDPGQAVDPDQSVPVVFAVRGLREPLDPAELAGLELTIEWSADTDIGEREFETEQEVAAVPASG